MKFILIIGGFKTTKTILTVRCETIMSIISDINSSIIPCNNCSNTEGLMKI